MISNFRTENLGGLEMLHDAPARATHRSCALECPDARWRSIRDSIAHVIAGNATRDGTVRATGLSLLILFLVACEGGDRAVLHHDLLEDLPGLEKNVETRAIDLASEEVHAHLLRGFSAASWDSARERHFVRGIGKRSVVRFTLFEARELELVLWGRPVPRRAHERVQIAVNRDVIEEIELEPKLGRYRVKLPGSALRRGENTLYLTYSGDAKVVAWYKIQFSLAPESPLPSTNLSTRSLFLPYGSQITVPLLAPPEAQLRFRKLGVRGGRGKLKVDIQRDGAVDRTFEETQTSANIAYDLGLQDWTPLRLTLTALASEAVGPRAGIVLVEPGVWASERYLRVAEAAGTPFVERATTTKRPNVIVYLVDALRADRLGAYGYKRPISPEIDSFADRATLFEHAIAQASWTRPAVVSMFTGMWPAAHRVNRARDRLADESTALAEVLNDAGYETVAFVANPNVYREFGLGQGFDLYRHIEGENLPSDGIDGEVGAWLDQPGGKPPSDRINGEIDAWLDQRDPNKPFFLYVHTVDPHDPYEPPATYRQRFAVGTEELLALPGKVRFRERYRQGLSDLYDAEIAFNDDSFGRFVDDLEVRDLWDDALVIFLSDHGEEFQEHGGWTHGLQLFDESIRIPFIVKWPGQTKGERRSDLAQQIDLPSTILSELGLPWPKAFEGRDLAQPATDNPPTAFSYLTNYGSLQLSEVREDWKYMVRVDPESAWLFDRGRDPEETEDRSRDHPVRTDSFDARLAEALRPQPYWLTPGETVIDKKLEGQLRALGYLN
ncbi:MAG: sulfatase [Acidobacteria bacterium]|nr:sulfatase [Acidobacteriota bacterium]